MKIYISSASCISPQETFHHKLFTHAPLNYNNNLLPFAEPSYQGIIDAKQSRRMGSLVRTGVAAAIKCLQEAGINNVDAIISGTAYGCMQDSEDFLKSIVLQDEQALSPTEFIQSTHNLVSAQVALILKCYKYNSTYAHRGFSFEHALIDAILLLKENQAENILAGSADEMTEFTFNILTQLGLFKQMPVSNFDLYNTISRGSIAGQGSAFFLLSGQPSENNYAAIDGVDLIYKTVNSASIKDDIARFLAVQKTDIQNIDLLITGRNGDIMQDRLFDAVSDDIFKNVATINYKHLCGEYPTSSSFAMWLAANIIKRKQLPLCFENKQINAENIQRILIYNCSQSRYHSLILLSNCNG